MTGFTPEREQKGPEDGELRSSQGATRQLLAFPWSTCTWLENGEWGWEVNMGGGIQVHMSVFKGFRSLHVHFVCLSGYSSLLLPFSTLISQPLDISQNVRYLS